MKARYICTLSHAKKLVILLWMASFILALPIVKGQVNIAFESNTLYSQTRLQIVFHNSAIFLKKSFRNIRDVS